MQRRLGKRMFALLLVMLAVTTACEKKRKSRYVQGDGEYVYDINEFKGSTYTLKTGKKRTPGVTTRADELVVNQNSNVIRSFNSVDFELDTDLGDFSSDSMNNFDFYGKEDSEYKVQLDFTEEKLVFFKLAKREEIPTNEMTYAEDIGNGNYRVPLFGIPLTKVTVERIQDDRGKSTNRIQTFEKKFLAEATHFSTNVNTPTYFDSELKLDMLPASFFDEKNEWFYEWSIVDKPIALDNSGLELGMQLNSGKVRFAKTNNSVLLIDTNIADEAIGQDAEKLNVIFEIPVQWMDYRLIKTGEEAYLKEEAFNSIEEGARFWKDRDHALLQLDRVLSIDAASTNNIKIKKLEVGEDYFSFVIYDSLSKYSLHYSFSKKNEIVPGKTYPREDFKRFGFFDSFKELYSGNLNASEGTISRARVQNRMIPPNRTVTFHITENTPQDPLFLEAIQEAINGWNWAFAEAAKGTEYENDPIKVELDISKPVANGDSRYHKVSFYGYEIESGLLGYGPSVTDNRNGEIYSSTNHIYLRNYRESIIRNLVNYVRYKLNAYTGMDVDGITVPEQVLAVDSNPGYSFGSDGAGAVAMGFGVDSFAGPIDLRASTDTSFVRLPARSIEPGYDLPDVKTFNVKDTIKQSRQKILASIQNRNATQTRQPAPSNIGRKFMQLRKQLETGYIDDRTFNNQLLTARNSDSKYAQTCDMLAATSLTFKEIEDVCGASGTEFSDYVGDLQSRVSAGENIYRLDNERDVLLNCAQKLMKPTLIATLAHEFGHNFGLRHNFQGSADFKNFDKVDGKYTSRMASVMDYSHADADRGVRPAAYDIAAIRYGYYDSVLVDEIDSEGKATGSKVVSVKASKEGDLRPLEQRVLESQGPGVKVHPFMFCTDDHINGYPNVQVGTETPFCERWDQGADPVTKVRAAIDTLVTSILTRGARFDMENVSSSGGLAAQAVGRSMGGIRNVYDSYRFQLYQATKTKSVEKDPNKKIDDAYFDDETRLSNGTIADPEEKAERLVLGAEYDLVKNFAQKLINEPKRDIVALESEVRNFSTLGQHKIAAELAKNFFLQLAFAESNYCMALHANGNKYEYLDIEPLASARTEYYNATSKEASSCEGLRDYFESKLVASGRTGVSVDRVMSVGNPYDDVKYTSNPFIIADRAPLRAGIAWVRRLALTYMSPRVGLNVFRSLVGNPSYLDAGSYYASLGLENAIIADFYPSMLDGRTFRNEFMDRLNSRATQGVKLSTLVDYANKKLVKVDEKLVSLTDAQRVSTIAYFQEEKDFLAEAWAFYQVGAQSPKTSVNSKTGDTLFSSQQLNQFLSLGGASAYEYLVVNGSVAIFAVGSQSSQIIQAYNQTNETVDAIKQKQELQDEDNVGALAKFDEKLSGALEGYQDLLNKNKAHYQNLNDVLFQVRVCLVNSIVSERAQSNPGISPSQFATLVRYASTGSAFSIPRFCNAPREPEADGSLNQLTVFENSFKSMADQYISYAMTYDSTFFTEENLNIVLDKVGLPRSPSSVTDPKTTLETIFKSNQAMGKFFGKGDNVQEYLRGLEYKVLLEAIANLDKINLVPGTPADYGQLVATAREKIFRQVTLDEPLLSQLMYKRDMLFGIVTQ